MGLGLSIIGAQARAEAIRELLLGWKRKGRKEIGVGWQGPLEISRKRLVQSSRLDQSVSNIDWTHLRDWSSLERLSIVHDEGLDQRFIDPRRVHLLERGGPAEPVQHRCALDARCPG